MDLLEYQAKKLFQEVGIPILSSQTIHDPRELKKLQIPYPVVLKSQVRVGGRGKAGGIRFVENTIDAIAAAQIIFNLPILGQYPQVLLAESRYNAEKEFFLAIVLDYELQKPLILGSAMGGMNVERLLENLQKVVIESDFSPFYARKLAIKMGLSGNLIVAVSQIIEQMYYLFREQDLDLIEINPLAVSAEGEIMALDGKITINDDALGRHLDLEALLDLDLTDIKRNLPEINGISPQTSAKLPPIQKLEGGEDKGNIAIISNNVDLVLSSWDLLSQDRGKIATALIIGQDTSSELILPELVAQQLQQAITQLLDIKTLKVILINIIDELDNLVSIASAIADYSSSVAEIGETLLGEERMVRPTGLVEGKRQRIISNNSESKTTTPKIEFVLRLLAPDVDGLQSKLEGFNLELSHNLGQAITKTLNLAKAR